MTRILGLFLTAMLWAPAALALPSSQTGAPEALAAWQAWALHGYEDQYLCVNAGDGPPRCLWPMRLSLSLDEEGGVFAESFELKKEREVPLPGGPGAWPEAATLDDGSPVPVLGGDRPRVWLPAGRHTLRGSFQWDRLPETIDLPLGFVLDLRVNGRPLDFPAMEADYKTGLARLWLKKSDEPAPEAAPAADSLSLTVNRLLQDSQPMMIKSRFRLAVSGSPREVVLKNVLLPETKATFLSSPLPAQLTAEGLRVRVKPGVYEIFIDSRSLNRSESVGPTPEDSPTVEYWAFQAVPELRLTEISGADQIDPSQADIYPQWRNFPIYALKPGASLTFETIRRGDPEPAPNQLYLARECWLDYDGRGLTCRDSLSGTMTRQRHLNTTMPFTLTQASLSGQPQVITWQTDSKGEPAPGLQLREGRLDLKADLRIDDFQGRLPASGWDHKLDTRGQRLNLPPGYRLWHASGADAGGYGDWTGAWRALDFFIILVVSIAMGKLYGLPGGALALAALVLCFHEPGSPRLIFLPLLACAALLRLLPEQGKIVRLVRAVRFAAALTLAVLAALFLISQARAVLYPQLDAPSYSGWGFQLIGGSSGPRYADQYYRNDYDYEYEQSAAVEAVPATLQNELTNMRSAKMMAGGASLSVPEAAPAPVSAEDSLANRMVRLNQAPDAKVQNSAPRPAWSWRSVTLNFNESVTADQEVRLYLAGPATGRLLGLVRIILMTAFVLAILDLKGLRALRLRAQAAAPALALMLMLPALALTPSTASAQEGFPGPELLKEYRQRLLERKPVPGPALSRLALSAEAEKLTLVFTVSAAEESIVALPNLDRNIFRPEAVRLVRDLRDEGRDLPLIEERGRLLTLVPPGIHQLKVQGRLKKASSSFQAFQINFPPDARPRKVEVRENPMWKVEGLQRDGQLAGSALYLTAQGFFATGDDDEEQPDNSANVILDPFFMVQRTISLGLEWRVHTVVRRITPTGAPVSLKLPLLPGENPVGYLGRDGDRAIVNFDPQAQEVRWESRLAIVPEMELTAEDGPWSESWSLDASPIWRVEHRGLPPIHNINRGFWQPQWRPWPGEKLYLSIDRPQAVPGEYLVIDRGNLAVTAGENNQSSDLAFRVRTSQGGPYSFSLPEGAEVREFKVDGRSVPLAPASGAAPERAAAPTLTAPLSVGEHDIRVSWTLDQPLSATARTPVIDLGAPTANIGISMVVPENRWIVWTWGPLQGPAVQFWPLLMIVLLAAVILSRAGGGVPLGRLSWFLLGVGLIQLNIFGAMIVAGWLLMLGRRQNKAPEGAIRFNLIQILLVCWTLLALWLIYKGIEYGLLRNPDMLITGGGSYGQHLAWFTDRVSGPWPSGAALSLPSWVYKALMLAWSLWMAVSLVKWLKWGWGAFSSEGLWKKRPPRKQRKTDENREASAEIIDKSPQS